MRFVLVVAFFAISFSVLAAPKFSATVFQRPFTMPTNSFESSLSFDRGNFLKLGMDYGITDHTQIGLSWGGFSTAGADATQSVSLNLAQFLFVTHYASSMAKFSMPFNFDRMVLNRIDFGMPTYVPVIRGHFNLVFLENLASLKWKEETLAEFAFHVRFSWQATHALCLNLTTSPGTVRTAGNHVHMGSILPVSAMAIYAVTPMVDIIADAGFGDVTDIRNLENFSMMLGVLVRGGDIEG
ncbi:MAG: hypothetical protein WCK49_04945 [Myxococcaceae bacterium]